ncbi:MAG: protoheme IX farnesyltransferase [Gemmatimonadales bacterium]|jgi:protoheme IX farnesyltransferase|nr:MAG: protoheme IX farnesyltransferase [Gemmatimonadales bacterium]
MALPTTPVARPTDFLELAKARIVGLVLVTVAAGFYVANPTDIRWVLLLHTLIGTAMVAAGTNALNQILERDVDALMHRTANRPLPTGRITVRTASAVAWAGGALGVGYLALLVAPVVAALAALTLLTYVFVYTPLKRTTSLATLVGAVPGALPIVGGWVAAGGPLGGEALVLFAVLFLWQIPHFLALAWMYREDYSRAGLHMLSVDDLDGTVTFRQATLYALVLVPFSVAPVAFGLAGWLYFWGALGLSGWMLQVAWQAARCPSRRAAGRLFKASVLYLPALLALLVSNAVR